MPGKGTDKVKTQSLELQRAAEATMAEGDPEQVELHRAIDEENADAESYISTSHEESSTNGVLAEMVPILKAVQASIAEENETRRSMVKVMGDNQEMFQYMHQIVSHKGHVLTDRHARRRSRLHQNQTECSSSSSECNDDYSEQHGDSETDGSLRSADVMGRS